MTEAVHRYKDYKVYACFVLNKLVSAIGIDIYQADIETKIDDILARTDVALTKSDVRHEIRSNHTMTEKVLGELEAEGLVRIETGERKYLIRITRKGVFHIRRFNEFYTHIYEAEIRDHYKYSDLPRWFTRGQPDGPG